MEKNKSMTIMPVKNGFIISQMVQYVSILPDANAHVFNKVEDMVDYIKKLVSEANYYRDNKN
jgi:hypothetical protein